MTSWCHAAEGSICSCCHTLHRHGAQALESRHGYFLGFDHPHDGIQVLDAEAGGGDGVACRKKKQKLEMIRHLLTTACTGWLSPHISSIHPKAASASRSAFIFTERSYLGCLSAEEAFAAGRKVVEWWWGSSVPQRCELAQVVHMHHGRRWPHLAVEGGNPRLWGSLG